MINYIQKYQTGGTAPGFNEAKDWTKSYINSPKYKQRLTRMNNTEKVTTGEYPNGSVNNPVNKQILERNNNLINIKPEIVKSIPGDIGGDRTLAAYDTLGGGQTLRMRSDVAATPEASALMAHEFSHGSIDGGQPYSQSFNYKYVSPMLVKPGGGKFNSTYSPYLQAPTEMKAKLDSIRFQMQKKGIHDARTEEFTPEQLNKLKADKDITSSQDYIGLDSQLPANKKNNSMLWLFNNIAQNKTNSDKIVSAQQGGTLGTKLPSKKWMVSYMDSDIYKKRLAKIGADPVTKEQRQELLNTHIALTNDGATRLMPKSEANFITFPGVRTIYGIKEDYLKRGVPNVMMNPEVSKHVKLGYGADEFFSKDFVASNEEVLTHELSHAQRKLSEKENKFIGNIYNKQNFKYDIDAHDKLPDEQKADLDAVRHQMFKRGIYDTSKRDMTMDDFNKAKADPSISKSFTFQRLLKAFTPENVIKFNNTIASVKQQPKYIT